MTASSSNDSRRAQPRPEVLHLLDIGDPLAIVLRLAVTDNTSVGILTSVCSKFCQALYSIATHWKPANVNVPSAGQLERLRNAGVTRLELSSVDWLVLEVVPKLKKLELLSFYFNKALVQHIPPRVPLRVAVSSEDVYDLGMMPNPLEYVAVLGASDCYWLYESPALVKPKALKLYKMYIADELPLEMSRFEGTRLSLDDVYLKGGHDVLWSLTRLESLRLRTNIDVLSNDISRLTALRDLNIPGLKRIPQAIGQLTNLLSLKVSTEQPRDISLISGLMQLTCLELELVRVKSDPFPPFSSTLTSLRELEVGGFVTVSSVPDDLFSGLDSLQKLNFRLEVLQAALPESLWELTQLRDLCIGYHEVEALPAISRLTCLSALQLNALPVLQTLPEISSMFSLCDVMIKDCNEEYLQLPGLDGLSNLTSLSIINSTCSEPPSLPPHMSITDIRFTDDQYEEDSGDEEVDAKDQHDPIWDP